MKKFSQKSIRLKKNHTWKAKSGYKIFVADKGVVQFLIPEDWVVVPVSDSIELYDRQSPDDNCRLAVSYLRLPRIDLQGLPLSSLVQVALQGDERNMLSKGDLIEVQRSHLELAWQEIRFVDPNEKREAVSRLCLARGAGIQSLITCDFWPEDEDKFSPVWEELLDSLILGRSIEDPAIGPLIH